MTLKDAPEKGRRQQDRPEAGGRREEKQVTGRQSTARQVPRKSKTRGENLRLATSSARRGTSTGKEGIKVKEGAQEVINMSSLDLIVS